jgi:hypothetical protein
MTPQPKTCGECKPTAWDGEFRGAVFLCPKHASAELLYEAAKAILRDNGLNSDNAQALRAAIKAYEEGMGNGTTKSEA